MALVRRSRFVVVDHFVGPSGYGVTFHTTWKPLEVIEDVPEARCYRCNCQTRRGDDHLVHVSMSSEDIPKPSEIYHYRCIPSRMWQRLAGSLPAWDLPSDGSAKATPSAADPTIG